MRRGKTKGRHILRGGREEDGVREGGKTWRRREDLEETEESKKRSVVSKK